MMINFIMIIKKTFTGRSGTNTLGIIFFCIFFGTVLGSMGRRAVPVIRFFRVMDEVSKLLTGQSWASWVGERYRSFASSGSWMRLVNY